ncbi:MAG: chemotaxis protein [Sulfuricurvum sp. PC08-66]|nr:MAG: chemotaxis protein [Sulfuricurvum sp. PC08-66]
MSEKLQGIINKQRKKEEATSSIDEVVQLVGFIVGDEEYTVPILSIQEIIKPIESTRVPQTPPYVLGVFNLRGSVIPLIDLRIKFGIEPQPATPETRFIVMKNKEEIAGFVIDRLTEAIRLNVRDIDPAPETSLQEKTFIDGVGKQQDRILTILKVDRLLERDF